MYNILLKKNLYLSDQEEAHKRLVDLDQNQASGITEDTGIQFIVTADQSDG